MWDLGQVTVWAGPTVPTAGLETYLVITKSHLGRQGLWLTVEVRTLTGGLRKMLILFLCVCFILFGCQWCVLLFLTFSMFKYIFILFLLFLFFYLLDNFYMFYIFIVFLSLLSVFVLFFFFVNLVLIVFISELDCKESWVPKNWCFWAVVLEKTLESPLDCKDIKPVNPKGNQSWIFIGRTDAEAEVPILWPPNAKSRLIRKDPDTGKDWRWEEKGTTEDEMVG